MSQLDIAEIIETTLIDYKKLPKNPFLVEAWGRHVFPMPVRVNDDEDYSCFTEEFINALKLTIGNIDGSGQINVLSYLVYGSDLAKHYPLVPFCWEINLDWQSLTTVMAAPCSYMGLYVWDSSFKWALVTVGDEYSMLGAEEEIILDFEKNYKSKNEIGIEFYSSFRNGHTFISDDVARELLSIYES